MLGLSLIFHSYAVLGTLLFPVLGDEKLTNTSPILRPEALFIPDAHFMQYYQGC